MWWISPAFCFFEWFSWRKNSTERIKKYILSWPLECSLFFLVERNATLCHYVTLFTSLSERSILMLQLQRNSYILTSLHLVLSVNPYYLRQVSSIKAIEWVKSPLSNNNRHDVDQIANFVRCLHSLCLGNRKARQCKYRTQPSWGYRCRCQWSFSAREKRGFLWMEWR